MKISKLFHWLYAILMLLPVFAIGVTCAYVIFNKNAYQSYYGETINEKTYEQATILDDNEKYHLVINGNTGTTNASILYISNVENIVGLDAGWEVALQTANYIRIYSDSSGVKIQINYDNNGTSSNAYKVLANYYGSFDFELDNYTGNINDWLGMLYNIHYNPSTYLSSVFYYSIEEVEQSPLFSWAYDSFLTAPIEYIVDLFSMPVDSPVVLMLSYWLTISIVWLCFDLIMYVPLLVHRWIDKGVLE